MNKLCGFVVTTATVAALTFSTAVSAVAPVNPGFEDLPDADGWTLLDDGTFSGAGFVLRGIGDATEGDAYARLSFDGWIGNCGGDASGPAYQSSTFMAGAGEIISFDWRVTGFYYSGFGDVGFGVADLVDADTLLIVDTFTSPQEADVGLWAPVALAVPADGNFFIVMRVWSFDATYGCLVGALLDLDNVTSSNVAPDCSEAFASKDMLWPPNHKFKSISVLGVTDPDGDEVFITIDSVFQDEPVNYFDDGNTCPDAMGIGTDTALLRSERVGGEYGYEGDGRVYRIGFTADDGTYGGTCTGEVMVGVPHDMDTPITDSGPLHDSTGPCE